MPAIIPFIPLIVAGVGAGASIYGANKQAGANEKATDAQSKSNQEALDFLKQKQQQFDEQNAPYLAQGAQGLSRLSALLGLGGGGGGSSPVNHTQVMPGIPRDQALQVPGGPNDPNTTTTKGTLQIGGQPLDPREAALRDMPGYQFQFDTGMSSALGSPLSRGSGFNSRRMSALKDFGYGLADQSYEEMIADMLAQAGLGKPAPPA